MVFLWYKCYIPTPDAVSLYTRRYTIPGFFDLTLSHHISSYTNHSMQTTLCKPLYAAPLLSDIQQMYVHATPIHMYSTHTRVYIYMYMHVPYKCICSLTSASL